MRKQHALVFITITVFLDTVGFGIIVPILPEFLAEIAGVGFSEASAIGGYLVVSYAVTNFLFAPILGNLSDAYGRKPLLVISLFFYGVSYLLAGFATALWMLFIGRLLTGVTSATYAIANALIADVSPPDERAQNFGLMGVAFGLGFICGPAIGGFVSAWDVRAPFFAAGALAFANSIYGLFFFKETLPAENRRPFRLARANPWGALVQLRRHSAIVGLLGAVFIFNIAHHVYSSNWNFYTIEKFQWTALDVGLSLGFVGICSVIVQGWLFRIVIPKFGAINCAYIGISTSLISFVGIALAASGLELYLWCLVSALGGLTGPSLNSLLSNRVEQNAQGELQGIVASMSSVAMIFGPLLMTQTFSFFTAATAPVYLPGSAFLAAAALTLFTLVIFTIQAPRFATKDSA